MTRWGYAVAAFGVALAVWGCVLLAHLMRPLPVILVPTEGPPMFASCRVDSTGAPRLVWFTVRLDR